MGRIIGTMAILLLLGGSAFGQFVVQPIIMKRQVSPGARGVPLDFKIENLASDSTAQVALRLVDLAKDSNGIWMEVDPNDPNSHALQSCKGWLTCPVSTVQVDPNQVVPIPITADIPSDANGLYFAALIVGASSGETSEDAPWGDALVQIQYLAPIILDVQKVPSNAAAASPEGLLGRVVDPNGRPVAGAQVGLTGDRLDQIMLRNAVLEPRWPDGDRDAKFVQTDADGRFRFEGTWSHPFYLFAAHATGFAPVLGKDFQKSREIRLEPWGRIEGQLATGRMGVDHRVWMLGQVNPASMGWTCEVRYDTACGHDGRFVFEKAPPGSFRVGYLIAIGEDCQGFTARTPVLVKTGGTATVKVGGEGRPIIGRFVAPASYGRPVYFGAGSRGLCRTEQTRSNSDVDQLPSPEPINDPYAVETSWWEDLRAQDYVVTDNQQEWYQPGSWPYDESRSAGDEIWSDMNWRGYAFRISEDGTFRIEDVVPGRYELKVELHKKDTWGEFAQYREIIEVPPPTETRMDQPFDAGALTLNVFGVGDPAPLFEAETADGKSIRLIDYRGKFVLLIFNISPALEKKVLPQLQELYRTYRASGDFEIIEESYANSQAKAKQYAVKYQVEWPVVHGSWEFHDELQKQYSVYGSMEAVLVDREGTIVDAHLWGPDRGEVLIRTVRDALEQRH
jgi:peroxiredoxin